MIREDIKDYVKSIKIPYLVHFTHISNLESILENGLLSRENVDGLEQEAVTNDELRLDDHLETVSVSIAHPNDKMFYKYRENDQDWCVIIINPRVMWRQDCLFYKHNAADARVSNLTSKYLASLESLKEMYEEIDDLDDRKEQCLKDFDPTDIQAEILVNGNIPTKYICAVVVTNRKIKKKYNDLSDDVKFIINSPNKGVYASRLYRRKWQ